MTKKEEISITADNQKIDYVENYKYLGQLISFKDQTGIEIESLVHGKGIGHLKRNPKVNNLYKPRRKCVYVNTHKQKEEEK